MTQIPRSHISIARVMLQGAWGPTTYCDSMDDAIKKDFKTGDIKVGLMSVMAQSLMSIEKHLGVLSRNSMLRTKQEVADFLERFDMTGLGSELREVLREKVYEQATLWEEPFRLPRAIARLGTKRQAKYVAWKKARGYK